MVVDVIFELVYIPCAGESFVYVEQSIVQRLLRSAFLTNV